jgi:hypothetical protein
MGIVHFFVHSDWQPIFLEEFGVDQRLEGLRWQRP